MKLKAVILAAGKGTRMKSDLPKVIHTIDGKTLVQYVIDTVEQAGADEICVIVGYRAEQVKGVIGDGVQYALQAEQLGTGHAVMQAADFIGTDGNVIVLCGDTPLVMANTLKKAVAKHISEDNSATALTAIVEDPSGYGRIIRDENGRFVKNVEHKDATEQEKASKEINAGMYIFRCADLIEALKHIKADNAQGEYYLPDVLQWLKQQNKRVDAVATAAYEEILGINTPEQLQTAADIMKKRK